MPPRRGGNADAKKSGSVAMPLGVKRNAAALPAQTAAVDCLDLAFAECQECRLLGPCAVDLSDGNPYCETCWARYDAAPAEPIVATAPRQPADGLVALQSHRVALLSEYSGVTQTHARVAAHALLTA